MAGCDSPSNSHRLYIKDRASNTLFLVDTGSDLSVFPSARSRRKATPMSYQLQAANGSSIKTYGTTLLSLNLGLRREFLWQFIVADVTKPIIGADFLSYFDLLVDLKRKCLLDGHTGLTSPGILAQSTDAVSVKTITGNTIYHKLLRKYPEITNPDGMSEVKQHFTFHHIRTSDGPPVTNKARRLPPDKLKAAREEFDKMIKLGIARPSDSPWSSPLHLTPKSCGGWRPCGDYRSLNARTIPDKYPVRCLEDFTATLHGKKFFQQ